MERKRILSTSYLRKIDTELKKVAKDNEIDKEELDEIVDEFFVIVKSILEDNRLPKVQITNLGTFKPTPGKINSIIHKYLWLWRKARITKEVLIDKIKDFWPIKQRLIKEKKGGETWKEWKNKKFIRQQELRDAKSEDKE